MTLLPTLPCFGRWSPRSARCIRITKSLRGKPAESLPVVVGEPTEVAESPSLGDKADRRLGGIGRKEIPVCSVESNRPQEL